MEQKVCCFFGHQNFNDNNAEELLYKTIEKLILEENVTIFLNGGMGKFDEAASWIVEYFRDKIYPQIQSHLVIPYKTKWQSDNNSYVQDIFNKIIYPKELQSLSPKAAIPARNRWMVEKSHFLISYVNQKNSDAYQAVEYAKEKRLFIFNLLQKA